MHSSAITPSSTTYTATKRSSKISPRGAPNNIKKRSRLQNTLICDDTVHAQEYLVKNYSKRKQDQTCESTFCICSTPLQELKSHSGVLKCKHGASCGGFFHSKCFGIDDNLACTFLSFGRMMNTYVQQLIPTKVIRRVYDIKISRVFLDSINYACRFFVFLLEKQAECPSCPACIVGKLSEDTNDQINVDANGENTHSWKDQIAKYINKPQSSTLAKLYPLPVIHYFLVGHSRIVAKLQNLDKQCNFLRNQTVRFKKKLVNCL